MIIVRFGHVSGSKWYTAAPRGAVWEVVMQVFRVVVNMNGEVIPTPWTTLADARAQLAVAVNMGCTGHIEKAWAH